MWENNEKSFITETKLVRTHDWMQHWSTECLTYTYGGKTR